MRHGKRLYVLIRDDGKIVGEAQFREQMIRLKAKFESWATQPWGNQ